MDLVKKGKPPTYLNHIIIFTLLFKVYENLKKLIHTTAREIMEVLKAKEFHCLIADGTGFGYSDTFKLLWIKGKEIRK